VNSDKPSNSNDGLNLPKHKAQNVLDPYNENNPVFTGSLLKSLADVTELDLHFFTTFPKSAYYLRPCLPCELPEVMLKWLSEQGGRVLMWVCPPSGGYLQKLVVTPEGNERDGCQPFQIHSVVQILFNPEMNPQASSLHNN
jgi:hypothetical protein